MAEAPGRPVNSLAVGAILVDQGADLPKSAGFESAPYLDGWNVITNSAGLDAEKAIADAGWTFLLRAGEVAGSAHGSNESVSMHAALRRIVQGKRPASCNSLEITQITRQRVFGWPCVRVSAHWRKIQQSVFPAEALASAIRNTSY
jgi:hypothetical protein